MHSNNLSVEENVNSRMKVRLETQTDVVNFVNKAAACSEDIILSLVDGNGMCVNARSLLGCMYATEFKHMWLVSNSDKIHTLFAEFARG